MRRALLLAVVVVAAGSAHDAAAAGRLSFAHLSRYFSYDSGWLAGPALAGDRVIWAYATTDGYDVVTHPLDGSPGTRHHVPMAFDGSAFGQDAVNLDLDASPRRFALGVDYEGCYQPCGKEPTVVPLHAEFVTGRVGQAPRRTPHCARGPCRRWCGRLEPHVTGAVVLTRHGNSCTSRAFVRDYAAGPRATTRTYTTCAADIDGDLVALGAPCGAEGRTRVLNWRTGRVIYSLAGVSPSAVQSDGTVAYLTPAADGSAQTLEWASAAEPFGHPIATARQVEGPLIARDRLAYQVPPSSGVATAPLVVSALDGREVARVDGDVMRRFDFDGRRLAWFTRPCQRAAVAVWDLRGQPPSMPGGSCPLPTLRLRSTRLPADGRIPVTLRCPARPRLGCAGEVDIWARRPRHPSRRQGIGYEQYWFGPGKSRARFLDLDTDRLCAGHSGRVQVWIRVWGTSRLGSDGPGPSVEEAHRLRPDGVATARC